jgi:hypothetical protein
MKILDLLFEPYVIIILLSVFITTIAYFVINNDNSDKEDDEKTEMGKSLLYTFIGSLVILTSLRFLFSYMNQKNFFQKGGDINDRLTIVADDVDVGLYDA